MIQASLPGEFVRVVGLRSGSRRHSSGPLPRTQALVRPPFIGTLDSAPTQQWQAAQSIFSLSAVSGWRQNSVESLFESWFEDIWYICCLLLGLRASAFAAASFSATSVQTPVSAASKEWTRKEVMAAVDHAAVVLHRHLEAKGAFCSAPSTHPPKPRLGPMGTRRSAELNL